MFGFLRRLFGGKTKGAPGKPDAGASAAAPASPAPRRELGVTVHRDEIIGEHSRLVGYRFRTLRQGGGGTPPTAEAALAALQADNVAGFAQRRLALIVLSPDDWLAADFRSLISQQTLFLLEAAVPGDADCSGIAAEIKSQGGRLAFAAALADGNPRLLDLADMLLINFRSYPLEDFEALVCRILGSHPRLLLVAEGMASWAEYRLCQAKGVRHALGDFVTQLDEENQGGKLGESRLVLMEMLNLLRGEADPAELAAVAKRDPGVTMKILDMANSPLSGLSSPVGSINQALMVLGRDLLYRWLSLGIYRVGGSGRDETLLEIALCRARFLELVGQGIRVRQETDELFLVGMLSLLDALLGMPMERAIEKMALPKAVRQVLIESDGPYARFVLLALAMEKGRTEQMAMLAAQLGIPADILEESRIAAHTWAEQALEFS